MSTFGSPTPPASNYAIAPGDANVPQAGDDGVSSISWSPTANILVSSNWDGGVRCWEAQAMNNQVQAVPKAQGEEHAH
jgi:mRNA export factor